MIDGAPVPRTENQMEQSQLVLQLYRDSTGFVKRQFHRVPSSFATLRVTVSQITCPLLTHLETWRRGIRDTHRHKQVSQPTRVGAGCWRTGAADCAVCTAWGMGDVRATDIRPFMAILLSWDWQSPLPMLPATLLAACLC